MDVIGRVWGALPAAVRTRLKTQLAARNIGVLPVEPPIPIQAPDTRLSHLAVLLDAPTEMSFEERLYLYALVRGTRPARILEIGTSRGGSAAVFAAALEANGAGVVIGIEPLPRLEVAPEDLHGRFHLVQDISPNGIPAARELAGGPFDLVLIDGMHIYQQTADDLAGVLPHMSDTGYVLFHDAFHFGVSEAVREAVERETTLVDCGYVCSEPRRVGDLLTHAGFRMLRRGSATVDVEALVKPVWDEVRLPPPHDPDLRNHDIFYCEYVERCAYCVRTRGALDAA